MNKPSSLSYNFKGSALSLSLSQRSLLQRSLHTFQEMPLAFSGSDGLLLNSQALDDFLEALSSTVGTPVDVNAALSLVVCTVTSSDWTKFKFDDTNTYVFEGGAPVSVASYQCAVVIGA